MPAENGQEAAIVDGLEVHAFAHLNDLVLFLQSHHQNNLVTYDLSAQLDSIPKSILDFEDVKNRSPSNAVRRQQQQADITYC